MKRIALVAAVASSLSGCGSTQPVGPAAPQRDLETDQSTCLQATHETYFQGPRFSPAAKSFFDECMSAHGWR